MGSKFHVDGESDISDSEINEYKETTYKLFKFRTYKIRGPSGKLKCPFCADTEGQDYTQLLQHAIRVAEGSAERAKHKANHFAMATYLVNDVADEVLPPPQSTTPAAEWDDDCKNAMDSVRKLVERLMGKEDDRSDHEGLTNSLILTEIESRKELKEARDKLIEVLKDIPSSSRVSIGVKKMGAIDDKHFKNACKKKFGPWEGNTKALELCSLWQEKVKNPQWHPFRVVKDDKGDDQKKLNEDDELLQGLKKEWGKEIHDAVVVALEELQEYNPSGGYEVSELWNFQKNRKATLKEGIDCILSEFKTLKRKRA